MNKKFKVFATIALLAVFGVLTAGSAYAQLTTPDATGKNVATGNEGDLIDNVTDWILGITGAIAVIFIIYGGFRYITASGNSQQMETAKNILIKAIIGLVIIVVAYVIVKAVLNALT